MLKVKAKKDIKQLSKMKSKTKPKPKPKPKPKSKQEEKQKQKQRQIVNIRIGQGQNKPSEEPQPQPQRQSVPTVISTTQYVPQQQSYQPLGDLISLFKTMSQPKELPKELPKTFANASVGENIPLRTIIDASTQQSIKPARLYDDNVSDVADLSQLKGLVKDDDEQSVRSDITGDFMSIVSNTSSKKSRISVPVARPIERPTQAINVEPIETNIEEPAIAEPNVVEYPDQLPVDFTPIPKKTKKQKAQEAQAAQVEEPQQQLKVDFKGFEPSIEEETYRNIVKSKESKDSLKNDILIMFGSNKSQLKSLTNDFRARYNIEKPFSQFNKDEYKLFLNELTSI